MFPTLFPPFPPVGTPLGTSAGGAPSGVPCPGFAVGQVSVRSSGGQGGGLARPWDTLLGVQAARQSTGLSTAWGRGAVRVVFSCHAEWRLNVRHLVTGSPLRFFQADQC